MKKIAALLLSCSMAAALAACGSGSSGTGAAGTAATAAETAAAGGETTKAQAEKEETEKAAADGDPYVLKFALQNGENHPLCQGIAKFGEILEEKSEGRIKLELFYSGALGDKATTVQGLQTGTIDGAMLMSGVIADYGCDRLGVFTLPYLFDSVAHARAFEKGEDGSRLSDADLYSGA